MQKPASECYIIQQFIGIIEQQSMYYSLLIVEGLHVIRNRTKNLH